MIHDIVNCIALLLGGVAGFACLVAAYRLARGDSVEYARNQQRMPGFFATLEGRVTPVFEGTRDYRVAAGLAVDRHNNAWVEQGRLSDEAVASVFRDPTA